eukprot:TRINITY_DN1377_c1_g1_i1.p1 TRINITY_DN1377_c1_g1~~TRINITY_DN1377_c1_g1_i1.p1  ORF type:complete len:543 (+),score=108.33 TRINITY_DN1377_c1_g1_i1:76-1704(+)
MVMWNGNETDRLVHQTLLREVGNKNRSSREGRDRMKERGFWKGPFATDSKRSRSGGSTPWRMSTSYAAKRGWDQTSRTSSTVSTGGSPTTRKSRINNINTNTNTNANPLSILQPVDVTTINPLEAVRTTLRTLNTNVSETFIRNLLCMLSDEYPTSDTVAGCKSFLQLENNRKNKLTAPAEGWYEVRKIVVSDHGSLRGAFANMCRGRRGGVMTGLELKTDFTRLGLLHCVPHIVKAVDPDAVNDNEVCIGLEEFVWILNGGRDCEDIMSTDNCYSPPELNGDSQLARPDSFRVSALEKRLTELESVPRDQVEGSRFTTLEQRLAELENQPATPTSITSGDMAAIERRVAQLEQPIDNQPSDEVDTLRKKITELEQLVKQPKVVPPKGSPVDSKEGSFSYQKSMTRGCSPSRARYGHLPSTKSIVSSPSGSMRVPPKALPPSVPFISAPHEANVEIPSQKARRSRSSPSMLARSPSWATPGVLRSFSPKKPSFVKTFSPRRPSTSDEDDSTVLSDTEIKFATATQSSKGKVPKAPKVDKQAT